MPSVDWNRRQWNDMHGWDSDGDEWSGMAAYCGQTYGAWKDALVRRFVEPGLGSDSDALEIAPGFGRWTAVMAGRTGTLTLVDLSPRCIEVCQERFGDLPGMRFVVNDGSTLPGVPDSSIDFIWSFDSFVHMELPVIDGYLAEMERVLRPGGRAVIHHAGKRNWSLRLVPATSRAGRFGRMCQQIASQGRVRDSGNRGNVSRQSFATAALRRGLSVAEQTSSWGDSQEFTVDKYGDCISVLVKP